MIRTTPAWCAAAAAVISWTVVAVMSTTGDRARERSSRSAAGPAAESARPGALHVSVTIEPPSCTALPPAAVTDPTELRVVEGSTVRFSASQPASIARDGAASGGTFVAARSGYVSVTAGDAGQRLIPIVVMPDALPIVRMAAPGRDLVFENDGPRVAFEAHATDDYGLRSLTLRFTKVSGLGEEYTFDAGEIPLTLTRTSARDWSGTARPSAGLHRRGCSEFQKLPAVDHRFIIQSAFSSCGISHQPVRARAGCARDPVHRGVFRRVPA